MESYVCRSTHPGSLPPYSNLNTPGAYANQAIQFTHVSKHTLDLFSSKNTNEFDKAYSFRIKSSINKERVFRLHYFPKHGIEGFRKLIDEKIQYTTQSLSSTPFAIGYFDQYKDLITISIDQDLLGCVHWNNLSFPNRIRAIQLIVYDIKNHSSVVEQFKREEMLKRAIICCSVVLPKLVKPLKSVLLVLLVCSILGMCAQFLFS
ncbi:hypothetical protein CLIB1423_27S00892 [[Candida] railenensis]|uniref:Uncharacterized protein n=1 Tax=[Candida] railenensis TaxID=45579 RepID=A0A9P0QUY8_9ASCO|nr:hypothetical protein CLIB1423_27S00892 [[Candida] railenensis]